MIICADGEQGYMGALSGTRRARYLKETRGLALLLSLSLSPSLSLPLSLSLSLCLLTLEHLFQEDHDNILRSRATGKGALTSPFKLLKSNHLGVVLTFTVYKYDLPPNATPEERIHATLG